MCLIPRRSGSQSLFEFHLWEGQEIAAECVSDQGDYSFLWLNKRKSSLLPESSKEKRQQEYVTIFMNGKQKRIKRPVLVDGMDVEKFIWTNADPVWLHQNELWEYIDLPEEDDLIMKCAKKV